MEVYVETDHENIKSEIKADSRGRITLGKEFAGETVSVAVLEQDE